MIIWLRRRWYARCRRIDIETLWPSCRKFAQGDLERARAAFAIHAHGDNAWRVLGSAGINRIVKDLY